MARKNPHLAATKTPAFLKPGDAVRLTYGLPGKIVTLVGSGLFDIKHDDGRVARYHATQFSRV